jgi:hypothetical protein
MEAYLNYLDRTEWALLISLAMLVFFMTAFFISSSQRSGKIKEIRLKSGENTSSVPEKFDHYETRTNWISLRSAGALSHSGQNGSRFLSRTSLPQEIRDLIHEIGFEITVHNIQMQPERHVRLEIKVNERGFFEVGKRKGPSPFEYTLPRVTHSTVELSLWQPFVNLNKEQVYSQIRFGRLRDADSWRIVFEIQSITDSFSHIDYEIYWERVQGDAPARVDLGPGRELPKTDKGPYFRSP